jgi:hypothetical protein
MSSSDLEAYLGRDTRAADTMRAGPRLAAVQPPTCHLGISEASLKRLWTANVVRDQYTNTTLPEDLKPLLVLDASGRVRRAYQSWANGNRKDIVSITASSKIRQSYNPPLAERRGKVVYQKRCSAYRQEVAALPNASDKRWLIIYHENMGDIDMRRMIDAQIKDKEMPPKIERQSFR